MTNLMYIYKTVLFIQAIILSAKHGSRVMHKNIDTDTGRELQVMFTCKLSIFVLDGLQQQRSTLGSAPKLQSPAVQFL